MATHTGAFGSKLGPRVAMLVSQSIVYTHARLVAVKHKVAMMVFHAISDEISEEVHQTLGPIFGVLHAALPDDSPAKASLHFMHTKYGQLQALAGTGLQASGLLSSIATIMNNELATGVYDTVRSNPHMLPDLYTLARLVATGRLDPATGVDAIAAQGIDNGWAQQLISLNLAFPTVPDGLEMMRRGLITRDQFAEWAAFNGIPENVVGIYLNMVDNPISVADAALAVLRGNIDTATANAIATENGISLEQFQILINNTGEPPGLMQLLEGYRRGFIDQATLVQGIKDSRYRDNWIPMLEQLRYSPMSVADAVNATVQNQMDATTARGIADQNGLTPGAFDILLNTAGEPLSRTEMEELYNRGLVSETQVNQALLESRVKNKYVGLAFQLHAKVLPIFTVQNALRTGGMDQAHALASIMAEGYSQTDATEIVNSASQQRVKTYRDQVVAAVHALYEDNLISAETASGITTQMGYTKDETAFITQSAELRREAKVTQTAVNAIRGKYLQHHITVNEATGFLDAFKVPAQQRDQLLALWEIEASAYTRALTEAQIIKALTKKLITETEANTRLINMGYSAVDAALLIAGA